MIQKFYTNLSDKEKKIFYIAVVFILLAFIDRLFLGPVLSKLQSLDEEIVRQESSIKRDLRFLNYRDRILFESKLVGQYFSPGTLTEEEIIAAFLKKIEILATQANVNLIKVTPSEGKQRVGYIRYSADLECEGELDHVISFMHLIDTSRELMRIIKLTMNPKRGETQQVKALMTISKIIVESSGVQSEKTPALVQKLVNDEE